MLVSKISIPRQTKTLAIGVYPDISFKDDRQLTLKACVQINNGIDLSKLRKFDKLNTVEKSSNLFSKIAKDWCSHQKGTWKSDHANRVFLRLEQNVFPLITKKPTAEIKPQKIIQITRAV